MALNFDACKLLVGDPLEHQHVWCVRLVNNHRLRRISGPPAEVDWVGHCSVSILSAMRRSSVATSALVNPSFSARTAALMTRSSRALQASAYSVFIGAPERC